MIGSDKELPLYSSIDTAIAASNDEKEQATLAVYSELASACTKVISFLNAMFLMVAAMTMLTPNRSFCQ